MYSRGRAELAGLGSGHDCLLEKGEEFSVRCCGSFDDGFEVVRSGFGEAYLDTKVNLIVGNYICHDATALGNVDQGFGADRNGWV